MLTLKEMILPLIAVVLIVGPIALIFSGKISAKNAKTKMLAQISIFAGVFAVMMIFQMHQFTVLAEDGAAVWASCLLH